MKWDELSLKEKNVIIGNAVKLGYNKLEDIKSFYNSFAKGGDKSSVRNDNTIVAKPKIIEPIPAYDKNTMERNPFYNMQDDTYGTVPMREVTVRPNYKSDKEKRRALNMAEGRRGAKYMRDAISQYATPIGAAIMGGAALGAMNSTELLSPVINPIDVASVAVNPTDPLNYLPLTRGASKVGRQFIPSNLRKHIYSARVPIGYNMSDTPERLAKSILSGKTPDINHVWWEDLTPEEISDMIPYAPNAERALKARTDAWRMYLGFPQKHNTFTPIAKHPGYWTDIEGIKNLESGWDFHFNKNNKDIINGVGGNIGIPKLKTVGKNSNSKFFVLTFDDTWDLHPFRDKKLPKSKMFKPIKERLDNLEVGSLFGGKPFKIKYEIPISQVIDPSDRIPYRHRGFFNDGSLPEEVKQFMVDRPDLDYTNFLNN
jgi:hypothetical protein